MVKMFVSCTMHMCCSMLLVYACFLFLQGTRATASVTTNVVTNTSSNKHHVRKWYCWVAVAGSMILKLSSAGVDVPERPGDDVLISESVTNSRPHMNGNPMGA